MGKYIPWNPEVWLVTKQSEESQRGLLLTEIRKSKDPFSIYVPQQITQYLIDGTVCISFPPWAAGSSDINEKILVNCCMPHYLTKISWQQLTVTQFIEIAFIIFEAATFFGFND